MNDLVNDLLELRAKRVKQLEEKYPDIDIENLELDDLYELDDYDCLIQGIDIVVNAIE